MNAKADILSSTTLTSDIDNARWRRHAGRAAVGFAALTIGALGVWGLTADRSSAASVGTELAHDGGTYTVVSAWTMDDPMMAMMGGEGANADAFADAGMSMGAMSQMMSDAVPEGMKRVAVQLTLAAGDGTMSFPSSAVRLVAGDVSYAPYKALLADEALSANMQLSGIVTFEVPMETMTAEFVLAPDADPVAVDVSRGPDGGEPMIHEHDG